MFPSWMVLYTFHNARHNILSFRDGETTIKIKFALLRGWVLGAERKIV